MDPGEPTCWQCGFRPLVYAKDELHRVGITIDGEDWPDIWLCEECAEEISADLGALHLLEEVVEA